MKLNSVKINPFAVESPEKLTATEIVELFVSEHTEIDTVKQKKHTFIWGTRGSGKSMMFRYMEPACQIIINENFLKEENAYFAVYCPCKEGVFNKSEFKLLDNYLNVTLSEHLLNLNIAERIINNISTQIPPELIPLKKQMNFVNDIIDLFDPVSTIPSTLDIEKQYIFDERPLEWLLAFFLREIHQIGIFLRKYILSGKNTTYSGTFSGYHDFLLPLMKIIRSYIFEGEKIPIYILLDDANNLTPIQQSIVNTWIANRDQSLLCVKVSASKEKYNTFMTRDGGRIEQIHDYSEVDTEDLYTSNQSGYALKIKKIVEKRLALYNLNVGKIDEFLPSDPNETILYNKIRTELENEWEGNPQNRPNEKKDYIKRLVWPRVFQSLKQNKQPKSYAGLQNLIDLSSGVVRGFLEPCYLMFDRVSNQTNNKLVLQIPVSIQEDVIRKYSEEFLVKIDEIKKDIGPEKLTLVEGLRNLIFSLGSYYYSRLHNATSNEPRAIAFYLTGEISSHYQEILQLGIDYRYFQVSTSRRKKGGGQELRYLLNRRLAPAFKLDPSSAMTSRIPISVDMFILACENKDKFVIEQISKETKDGFYVEQLLLFSGDDANGI